MDADGLTVIAIVTVALSPSDPVRVHRDLSRRAICSGNPRAEEMSMNPHSWRWAPGL
jgi:hypothetical protein